MDRGLCCKRWPTLTVSACEQMGGRLIPDPGDGSTHRNGCPNGGRVLGAVCFGIEGAICCE